MSVHFAFKWPLFGTVAKPKPLFYQEQSVYYWWFQYLRRSENYLQTCKNGGVGPCSELYKDFGDIYGMEFREWWRANGAKLFGEHEVNSIIIHPDGAFDPALHAERKKLVLSVPLDLPQSYLIKRFREILKKHHEGVRGRRHHSTSQAKYPTGGKIDVRFLKSALQVWDMRKSEPDKQLWAIANDLKLAKEHLLKVSELKKKGDAAVVDKKNVLAATASRHFRKAQRMIEGTEAGKFPNQ